MAEAFFRKYAPKEYEAISGGTQPNGFVNPVVVKVMSEIGIDMTGQKSKAISESMVKSSTKTVNMGCMDKEVCPATMISKMINWDLKDPKNQPIEKVREIRDEIEQKVKDLILQL
jgi:protein-tyrosine-phosphatase